MSRRFYLNRIDDESGVSGTGRVAEGVLFDNGKAVLGWNRVAPSLGVYDCMEDVENIHGHDGKTQVVWIDKETELKPQSNPCPECELIYGKQEVQPD